MRGVQNVETTFADLARRILGGDRQAEGALSKRLTQGITQIAVNLTGNFALAQEICQETLIILLTRLRAEPLDEPDKLPAFVAQTARNLVIAEQRKQHRRKTETGYDDLESAEDSSPGQEADAQRECAATAIRTVLSEMKSVRDRKLLVHYYLRDEEKHEICNQLGLSEQTFNVVLFRARARFLELMQKRGLRGEDLLCVALL
jgi:RNA polymerase sigma-70 factor (ECF subfamily)